MACTDAPTVAVAQFAFVMQTSMRRGRVFGFEVVGVRVYSSHNPLVLLYGLETTVGKFASYV